jgi:hypothetical protein
LSNINTPSVAKGRALGLVKLKNLSNMIGRSVPAGHDLDKTADEVLVELTGIEPVTPCLQSRCSPS